MKNKIKVIFLLSMFKLCNISAFADHWGIPKIDGQGPWNENLVISISNVKKKSLALTRAPQIEIKNYKRKKK